jgi:hypothetical protein
MGFALHRRPGRIVYGRDHHVPSIECERYLDHSQDHHQKQHECPERFDERRPSFARADRFLSRDRRADRYFLVQQPIPPQTVDSAPDTIAINRSLATPHIATTSEAERSKTR